MSSLAEMMFLQQQAQPQAQGPIERGAQAGIDAAQQTIAMSDIQRRRAQGAAMMEMAQHMFSPDYGHGFKGMMAGINAGIPHATNAYLGTEDRMRNENLAMLGRQDKLEKEALRQAMQQQKMAETERYHNALLADRAQRTGMLSGKLGNKNISELETQGTLPEDAISLNSIPANASLAYQKHNLSRMQSLKGNQESLIALDEMQKLSDEFPDLDTSFTQILLSGDQLNPKTINLIKRQVADPKKRAAIEKWAKLSNNLITSKVVGLSGAKGTDIMKKAIAETVPRMGQSKEARDFVINLMKDEHKGAIEDAMLAREGILHNAYIPPRIKKIEPVSISNSPNIIKNSDVNVEPQQTSSPQDLMQEKEAIMRRLQELRGG